MLEMSDAEYERSGVLDLVWFVLRVPFARAIRRRRASAWLLALVLAVPYEAFAIPLVVGSVFVLLVLMSPMLVIAGAMRMGAAARLPRLTAHGSRRRIPTSPTTDVAPVPEIPVTARAGSGAPARPR